MTSPEAYRYAAFISYRHVEPDRRWAKWLHGAIERYRVPRAARREFGLPTRIIRVFRDEDEVSASADLNTEIERALQDSRFLIVICSPRAPGSVWVNREIERFREMGRGDRILALLVEGEPKEAFPPALRAIRSISAADAPPTGDVAEIEPLAADVRPSQLSSRRHTARMAKLRLLSTVLGCRFDDLRRRDQERQQRRAVAFGLAALLLALILGGLALFAFNQRDQKQAALDDYDRLGDVSRLLELTAEADDLWPAEPSKVPAMSAWVKRAAELEKRLPGHREALARLRSSSGLLPYTDADRDADLKAHAAEQKEIRKLRAEGTKLAAAIAAESYLRARGKTAAAALAAESYLSSQPSATDGPGTGSSATSRPGSMPASRPSVADLQGALARRDKDIQRLDAVIHERLTWRLSSSAAQFKHDTTAKLVVDLTAFVDPHPTKGLLADVRTRLSFAESVERETIGKYETKWADAIRSIADKSECPKYNGLKITPQLGLIPLWKNEQGLWEFAHLQTTAPGTHPIPKRDKDGKLVVTESMGLVFVLIPSGAFWMGAVKPNKDQALSDPNVDSEARDDESPVTEVRLYQFFLSKYEMTQGQWLRLVGRNPSAYGPGVNFRGKEVVDLRNPVEQVSWKDCDLWLGRLDLLLPTEAQWEYAARGGTTTPRWTGIWPESLAKAANVSDTSLRETVGAPSLKYEPWTDGYVIHAAVGSFAPNPLGLHDVLGNVLEWCRDWFGGYNLKARASDGLRSPSAAVSHIARGGSFSNDAPMARSAARYGNDPEYIGASLGVRPARAVDP